MALTEEEKKAMRAATYDAATALVDDLGYMRTCYGQMRPTSGDIRRLSATIRRLLLDGHLQAVAAPRIGRVTLQTPDFEHWVTEGTFDFFTLGLAPIFGWSHGLFEFYRVTNMDLVTDDNVTFQLAPEITTPFREVSVQGFLSDRVIRARGTLVSRADLLKFICYHDFGVHFSGREEPVFTLIRRFRNMVTFFNAPGGVLGIAVSDHFDASLQRETLIDLAHAHTLSTGYYLATSADVVRLKVLIEAEMASAYPPAEDRPH